MSVCTIEKLYIHTKECMMKKDIQKMEMETLKAVRARVAERKFPKNILKYKKKKQSGRMWKGFS